MNIVVLAGGLSTERDVSFKTGSMVAKALKENGHKVILLDVFMGYSDREEDLTGIFDRADEISVQVSDIPTEAPDLAKVKASRKDQSPCFFGPNVIKMCQMADIWSECHQNVSDGGHCFHGSPRRKRRERKDTGSI